MSAKGCFLVVWLAFSAPWVAGTGIGVYAESNGPWDDDPATVAGPCTDGGEVGRSGLSAAGCGEKAVASLADNAVAALGQPVQPNAGRAAYGIVKARNVMDGMFILAPPLLLFVFYCLFCFCAWIARGFGPRRANVEPAGES